MSVAWTTLENAIAAWASTASGITCIWSRQSATQPALPYITLTRQPAKDAGRGGMLLDAVTVAYDSSKPTNQEMVTTLTGEREFKVTVEAFSNAVTGAGTASEYLESCFTALQLPSARNALWVAGLALRHRETVLDLSALVATAFQTRAQFDVVFGIKDVQLDTPTGYIAEVDIDPTLDGNTLPPWDIVLPT